MTRWHGALLLLPMLSGCSTFLHPAAPAPAAVPPSAPAAVEESRAPAGLVEFVATAPPGAARVFEDPREGEVRVTVGRQYYSAAALVCRHFVIAPLGGASARASVTRAACREGGGWRLDPIGTTGAVRFGG